MLVHVRFRNRSFDCVCQFLVSGSGQWKTAFWHLFNKAGRLVNQPSQSFTRHSRRPRPGSQGPWPRQMLFMQTLPDMELLQEVQQRCLVHAADRWQAAFQVRLHIYPLHPPTPPVSDVARNAADAAHADAAVATPQRRTAQAGGGRGPGWASTEVLGKEQSGGDAMQTEEKSMGDVVREESRRAHSDQHAASGTHVFKSPCHV